MHNNHMFSILLILAILLQIGCASSTNYAKKPPQTTPATQAIEHISEEKIRQELRPRYRALYGFGLALGLGTIGLLGGAKMGYKIDYSRDIKRGCEDWGLEGLVIGGVIGAIGFFTGGMILGQKIGAKKDWEEAVKRIRQRQSTPSEDPL